MRSPSSGKLSKILRRFRRSDRGSAAIEFAMVALPFLVMLFAIFEFALMFFAGQVLETATQDAARLIFTNQAQAQNLDEQGFKNRLCSNIKIPLFDCQGGLSIDVKIVPQFSSITPEDLAAIENGHLKSGFSYSNAPPGSTVIVRAFYQWPLFVNFNGYSLANLVGGGGEQFRLLTAMVAFRVEPGGSS